MRVAVISDSHGGMLHLERFVEFCKAESIDQVCHLGDVMDDVRYLRSQLDIPVAAVPGNCDVFSRDPRELCFSMEGRRFLLVHGDRYGVKLGCDRLSYYAEEKTADVALFGHTHFAMIAQMGRVLMINPGALKNGSMCLIEMDAKDISPRIIDIDQWYNNRKD